MDTEVDREDDDEFNPEPLESNQLLRSLMVSNAEDIAEQLKGFAVL